jgi:uncharacterized protein
MASCSGGRSPTAECRATATSSRRVEGAIPGGIGPVQGGAPLVTFFVGVEDVAATLQAATAAGGKVVQPATDVPGVRFGLFADPLGQVVGIATATG